MDRRVGKKIKVRILGNKQIKSEENGHTIVLGEGNSLPTILNVLFLLGWCKYNLPFSCHDMFSKVTFQKTDRNKLNLFWQKVTLKWSKTEAWRALRRVACALPRQLKTTLRTPQTSRKEENTEQRREETQTPESRENRPVKV